MEGLGVLDGVHARVVDDPTEMADAITEMITCDARATALADAGRQHVEEHFRWRALAERYADRIETLGDQVR
jgi:glycosyltransferase involved in cell wall biosynthesis